MHTLICAISSENNKKSNSISKGKYCWNSFYVNSFTH